MVSCYSEPMAMNPNAPRKMTPILRAMVEIGFIIFLFYANLLMGEFTQSNGHGKSLTFAIEDIFSVTNFTVAVVAGLIGYVVFEHLRKQL
jgi:hypothetical protein